MTSFLLAQILIPLLCFVNFGMQYSNQASNLSTLLSSFYSVMKKQSEIEIERERESERERDRERQRERERDKERERDIYKRERVNV